MPTRKVNAYWVERRSIRRDKCPEGTGARRVFFYHAKGEHMPTRKVNAYRETTIARIVQVRGELFSKSCQRRANS